MKNTLYIVFAFTWLSFCHTSFVHAQGIGINPAGNAPDSSAMLDISSANKGLLIPRLNHSTISSPATGLMVYDNVTNTFWYYNGTAWTEIGGSGSSGSTTVKTLMPSYPMNADYTLYNNNPTFWSFDNSFDIIINKLTFKSNSINSGTSVIRFGLYSEDGQTKYFETSVSVIDGGNYHSPITATLSSPVDLSPGRYYLAVALVSGTTVAMEAAAAIPIGIIDINTSGLSKPVGTLNISGALPATFNPAALLLPSQYYVPFVRLDN